MIKFIKEIPLYILTAIFMAVSLFDQFRFFIYKKLYKWGD